MNPNLSFCQEYNYPPELMELMHRIAFTIEPDAFKCAILLGSTARGEFSWQKQEDQFIPLSDLEFLLVTQDSPRRSSLELTMRKLREIEREVSRQAPSFHIDAIPISENALSKLPLIFRTFETRATGRVIVGQDLLSSIPQVTIENIDRRDLNEILIWRLWSLWLHMPHDFPARKQLTTVEDKAFAYVCARNMLDLPSWLLPRHGHLIAGFGARLIQLEKIWPDTPCSIRFSDEMLSLLRTCLKVKLGKIPAKDAEVFYRQTISMFQTAWSELAELPDGSFEEIEKAIVKKSSKLFPDWQWRRKGHEARTVLKNIDRIWIGHTGVWLMRPKYGPMLNLLMKLHMAIIKNLEDKEEADEDLQEVYKQLRKLSLFDCTIPGWHSLQFADKVINLRRQFAGFLMDYFPWVRAQRGFLERML